MAAVEVADFGAIMTYKRWDGERVDSSQEMWVAVHRALLNEVTFRAAGEDLAVPLDELSDFVDHLADVVIAKFVLVRR